MMRRYPLVLCCLLLSVFASAAETDTVEVLFVPLGKLPTVFPDDGRAQAMELVDGTAEFASLSQLPKSEYYIGYRLMAGLTEVEPFPGKSLSLTLWMADFKGFLELEDSKLTPMISTGVELFMMSRFNRNCGWVCFQLPRAIALRLEVPTWQQSVWARSGESPEQAESVEVAGGQQGVMLFVRWSGPVEEGADAYTPDGSSQSHRTRRLRMDDGQPQNAQLRGSRRPQLQQGAIPTTVGGSVQGTAN